MNLKRFFAASTAALMLALAGTTTFAHHGMGGCRGAYYGGTYSRQSAAATYQACPYEDCYLTDTHTHGSDGCYYYGHYEGDGHTHCAPSAYCYSGGGYCHNHW